MLLVITPTLGESPFLAQTVASVAAVAARIPLRHLIVCPADRAETLADRFPKVNVLTEEQRGGGLYGAIERGLKCTDGWTWFSYINDDDLLLPGFAEVARAHLARGVASIAYGRVNLIDENACRIAPFPVCSNPRWFYALWRIWITPFTQQGTIVPREWWDRLGGLDINFPLAADFAFWAKAIESGAPFSYYPREVAAFRIRRGQLSGDQEAVRAEKREILRRYFQRRPGLAERALARVIFRAANLPAYLERISRRGVRRSETLLGRG